MVGSLEEFLHLGDIALPDRALLIDHVMIGLVGDLYELIASHIEHADSRALRGIATIAEFQSLWSLESRQEITADILSVVVCIPSGTIVVVIIP